MLELCVIKTIGRRAGQRALDGLCPFGRPDHTRAAHKTIPGRHWGRRRKHRDGRSADGKRGGGRSAGRRNPGSSARRRRARHIETGTIEALVPPTPYRIAEDQRTKADHRDNGEHAQNGAAPPAGISSGLVRSFSHPRPVWLAFSRFVKERVPSSKWPNNTLNPQVDVIHCLCKWKLIQWFHEADSGLSRQL